MKVITKIGRQKNNEQRYNIYLDEQFAFAVDESTLIKFALTKGKVLEPFEIDEMIFDDEIAKAFNRALTYLSYQMRSIFEVKKKLKESGFGEAVVQEAIHKLSALGLLNDETYSKALLETKKRTMKKGPRAIRQDLQKKGIHRELQEEVLATFSADEQIAMARQLVEKELRGRNQKTPMQQKQKLQDLLMRKGYPLSIAAEVIESYKMEPDVEQWEQLIKQQGEKVWRKYAGKLSGSDFYVKVRGSLYQKGFPIEIINRFIEEKENDRNDG